jgi:hypothetical protein
LSDSQIFIDVREMSVPIFTGRFRGLCVHGAATRSSCHPPVCNLEHASRSGNDGATPDLLAQRLPILIRDAIVAQALHPNENTTAELPNSPLPLSNFGRGQAYGGSDWD